MMLHSSRPLILASGGDGSRSEYELASVYYQILNRRAADGAAYITVSPLLPEGSSPGLWNLLGMDTEIAANKVLLRRCPGSSQTRSGDSVPHVFGPPVVL